MPEHLPEREEKYLTEQEVRAIISSSMSNMGMFGGGAGSEVFKFDRKKGIWLGNAKFEDAPFRVTMKGVATAVGLDVEWINIGNTDGKKPADNADVTSANAQAYSWITGSKPPTNADHTADIVSAMAYESLVESAKLGTTIISGGYIKSTLLTANNIVAGTMSAVRINGGDINGVTITGVTITGGTVQTATSGTRVVMANNELAFYYSSSLVAKVYGSVYGLLFANGSVAMFDMDISPEDVYPKTGGIYDLGTSSKKWRHLYLDQNLYLDSGQNIYWNSTSYYLKHDGSNFRINDDLQPHADGSKRLGYTNMAWYAVHADNYLGCNLPTSDLGIEIFKKIKNPKLKDGKAKGYHAGKRHYFETDEFPDEMKMTDKDSGKKDIELTRCIGVTVSAVRELVETIDDLKSRILILETNKKL